MNWILNHKKWTIAISLLLLFFYFVPKLLISINYVQGNSMNPTINEGDRIIVSRIPFQKINRGDIVIAEVNNETLIKRVVALPNDEVVFQTGEVVINGNVLEEPYLKELTLEEGNFKEKKTLSSDEYLLLGDNRQISSDSRFFGTVKRNNIIGKVISYPNHN